jgi:hypothetical protein
MKFHAKKFAGPRGKSEFDDYGNYAPSAGIRGFFKTLFGR